TIITSQIPVDKWHELIGDPTYADAILDRIVHNSHRINLTGHSLRRSRGHQGFQGLNTPATKCKKLSASEAPDPGRHHLGMPGRLRRNPQSYCRVRLRCGFETSISERTDSQTLMALKCRQTADSIIAPSPKRLVEPHILPSLIGKGDGMSSARSSIQSGSCGYLIEPLLSTPCRAESTEPVIFSLSSALA